VLRPSCFMLRDKDFGVAYEGFAMSDVCNGAIVEVRDAVLEGEAEAAAAEARSLQADLHIGPASYFTVNAKSGRGTRGGSEFSSDSAATVNGDGGGGGGCGDGGGGGDDVGFDAKLQRDSIAWAKRMLEYGETHMSIRETVWQFLDDPGSSRGAMNFTMAMLTLIVFSTVTFCLETLPQFYEHEPAGTSVWFVMEATCIAAFTAEFIGRLASTPDLRNYFHETMNQVQVVTLGARDPSRAFSTPQIVTLGARHHSRAFSTPQLALDRSLQLNHVPVHKTHSAKVIKITTTSKTPSLTCIDSWP